MTILKRNGTSTQLSVADCCWCWTPGCQVEWLAKSRWWWLQRLHRVPSAHAPCLQSAPPETPCLCRVSRYCVRYISSHKYIFTDRVRGNSVVLYVSVAPKIKSQCHRFRSMINAKNVCYTSIYSGVLSVMIDGRGSRFSLWRNQLRASAARRAARRGRSQRQRRSPERVGVVTDWQRGRFDLDPR